LLLQGRSGVPQLDRELVQPERVAADTAEHVYVRSYVF
jgi:hypothetical protein